MSLYYVGERPKNPFAKPLYYLFNPPSKPSAKPVKKTQVHKEFEKRLLASMVGLDPTTQIKYKPEIRVKPSKISKMDKKFVSRLIY